jgi:RNA polymerase primary sigma factor
MERDPSAYKSYMNEISRHRLLTKQDEFDLFERLHGGDETARQEIIESNLRLVVRLSQRFRGRGLCDEDLIQEGNIGLLEVIDRFDHHLGFRFSTYAAFWIRQAIQVAVRRQGSMIRLPVRKARMLGRISEIVHEYQSLQGRMPTPAEMAERLEVSTDQLKDLLRLSRTTLSLDAPLDEDGNTLGEHVPDRATPLASETTMRREMTDKVQNALRQLTEREHSILRMRYGLHGRKPRSLRNISREVGLSQEGVRRVEQRALSKLARPHMRRQLAGLI